MYIVVSVRRKELIMFNPSCRELMMHTHLLFSSQLRCQMRALRGGGELRMSERGS